VHLVRDPLPDARRDTPVARVRLIGCGNPEAGDDALGLVAVRRAAEALGDVPGLEIVEAATGLQVLDLLRGADAVVIGDAVRAPLGGRPAGTLVRVEAGPEGLTADVRSSLSSHGLGIADAVGLAAALEDVPRVVFLGVEVARVSTGDPLSEPVAAALPGLVEAVVGEVRARSRP
jgi:hydrogenase maturation protease